MNMDFTYLKENKRDTLVDFLDKEIDNLNYLISCRSTLKRPLKNILKDYSRSVFVISDAPDDNDSLMLN
tara:strand:- start:430 stop:636 length:207 start_codon:yes stop_codon:yes gene_type:complete